MNLCSFNLQIRKFIAALFILLFYLFYFYMFREVVWGRSDSGSRSVQKVQVMGEEHDQVYQDEEQEQEDVWLVEGDYGLDELGQGIDHAADYEQQDEVAMAQ